MEKPKRNWRDFMKEYAIIVIGVLTALAAQQAAEWWNWRNQVAQARQSIRAEIRTNNINFFARRIAYAPCIDRQIDEASAIMDAMKVRRSPGTFTTFQLAFGALITSNAWESERASQVLTHFPRSELALMSRYYALAADFKGWVDTESSA